MFHSGSVDNDALTSHQLEKYYEGMNVHKLKHEPIDSVTLNIPPQLTCTLKEHQVGGVKRLMKMEAEYNGGILADDQGITFLLLGSY